MEDQEIIDPEYLKGFNDGYLIARHMPELAATLDRVEKNDKRLQGFGDGRRQFFHDQLKVRETDRYIKDSAPAKEISKDREIDNR